MSNKTAAKGSVFDKLPPSLIKKNNVTLIPEGAIGYLVGPTLALLANSVLSNYFNKYMTDVLHINSWASAFFTWLPVISVIFVVLGNILVGRLMDNIHSKNGKARPLLLVSVPISLLALLFLFVFSPYKADSTTWHTGALICIAIGYNLWFAFAYPMYYTPHAGLVNLSTRNSKDRSLLATISNATMLAAMGLSSMILPFFLISGQASDLKLSRVAAYLINAGVFLTLYAVGFMIWLRKLSKDIRDLRGQLEVLIIKSAQERRESVLQAIATYTRDLPSCLIKQLNYNVMVKTNEENMQASQKYEQHMRLLKDACKEIQDVRTALRAQGFSVVGEPSHRALDLLRAPYDPANQELYMLFAERSVPASVSH